MERAPYGTWASPISAATVATQGVRLGSVALDGDEVYWLEGRPNEGGRNVLVRRAADGSVADVTPAHHNVRTRVHEYGGGAYLVSAGVVYYSNFSDQRIYRMTIGGPPEPVTAAGDWRFADATLDVGRQRLICVREDHTRPGHAPTTTLVAVDVPASSGTDDLAGPLTAGEVLASGDDFYSTPRLSPDGTTLAWLSWRHPQMPWDGTELWVAAVGDDGGLGAPVLVAGGDRESVCQPGWSPDGELYFTSDRTGWWSLYRAAAHGVEPVLRQPVDGAECGRPQWLFGWSTWTSAGPTRIAVALCERGRWALATVDRTTGTLTRVPSDLEPLEWLCATPTHAVYVAASPTRASAVVATDLATGATTVLRSSSSVVLDPADISAPEAIEFPTADGLSAHAFYYPPCNSRVASDSSAPPPLIAISHGGPTTQARAVLDLHVQYWTSRGFAVVDVNYGGSSGYGRAYRERLQARWGIVDVDDTINAARFLVGEGKADPSRLIVRGGSAGGYTTLAALTFHPEVFQAGASYYGVSDVEALALDTHKFESRYLDSLIGPYPEAREVYRARSPIHFVDRLSCALILFQGLDDRVVPPDQSETMAAAVRAKGLPVAYLAFEGEQHGFRRADTIARCLEAELSFYGAVFGFTPAGPLQPVAIDNLR